MKLDKDLMYRSNNLLHNFCLARYPGRQLRFVLQYTSFKQITHDVSDALTAEYIFEPTRWQGHAWGGLSARQSIRTICVPSMMTTDGHIQRLAIRFI
jgi:surfactin synthase thioesterase subunit